MTTAVIVDAIRTPLGRRNGKLKDWHPVDLAAETLTALVERTGLDPAIVDDVIMGCVMQVGEQAVNIGRNAVLAAGWPESVPGTTIDRQCGSTQQAAHFAAQGVIAGAYDVVVAAGVEVMTRVPMGSAMADGKFGFPFGPKVGARYAPAGGLVPQGISAELIADKWGISREDLDAFGVRSQAYAAPGHRRGPLRRPRSSRCSAPTARWSTADEGLRDTTMESLGAAEAVVQAGRGRRPGHRRQLVADHRRRRGGADHERGEGQRARPARRGPASSTSPLAGDDPLIMLTGADPGHREGARAGRADARRHRPRRDQRGLRLGRAGVGEGAPPGHGPRSTSTAGPSPSATRSAARAPG